MKDLHLFQQFGKKARKSFRIATTNNCVIYTRVSSKDQRDNFSLPLQDKVCSEYAARYNFNVLEKFGGDYESAKTDERKEFKRMFNFIKKSRQKISYIIVYKLDRFSRTGPNAIYLKDQLQEQGIYILSVSEPSDPTTITGTFQQDIQLVVGKYDNAQRRERTIACMIERMESGLWCGPVPTGYDQTRKGKESVITINETGKLIKKAFEWKAYEGLSNTRIIERLARLGLKLPKQRLTDMFRNPFYCGLMSHALLNGRVLEGKHPALVSKEVFLLVNNVLETLPQGWNVVFENNEIPLKRFMKCDKCGKNMRGYLVKAKNIHYYKCGTIGCCANVNANHAHEQFVTLLKPFGLDEKYVSIVKDQLEQTFNEINHGLYENIRLLKGKVTEIKKKIERLEDRYVDEELDKELYNKHHVRLCKEEAEIHEELEKLEQKTSNFDDCIETAVVIASRLDKLWIESNYNMKQKLQNTVFPEGINYDKENRQCRTGRVNLIFEIIACISRNIRNKKTEQSNGLSDLSGLVARRGIEPLFPE